MHGRQPPLGRSHSYRYTLARFAGNCRRDKTPGRWRSWLARFHDTEEVTGSNPVRPTDRFLCWRFRVNTAGNSRQFSFIVHQQWGVQRLAIIRARLLLHILLRLADACRFREVRVGRMAMVRVGDGLGLLTGTLRARRCKAAAFRTRAAVRRAATAARVIRTLRAQAALDALPSS